MRTCSLIQIILMPDVGFLHVKKQIHVSISVCVWVCKGHIPHFPQVPSGNGRITDQGWMFVGGDELHRPLTQINPRLDYQSLFLLKYIKEVS